MKLEKLKTKKNIEVIILNGAPLLFIYQVLKYGKPIFIRDEKFRITFESSMLDRYFDFLPFIQEYNKIRFERLNHGSR
jgi:hypothetical protein